MNAIETNALSKTYGTTRALTTALWPSPTGTWSRWSGRTAPGSRPC